MLYVPRQRVPVGVGTCTVGNLTGPVPKCAQNIVSKQLSFNPAVFWVTFHMASWREFSIFQKKSIYIKT